MHVDCFDIVKINIFEDLEQFVLVSWFKSVKGFLLWNHTAQESMVTMLGTFSPTCYYLQVSSLFCS